jgi:YggT family protein
MGNMLFILSDLINIYKYILIARILLTWLPSINWYNQPFRFLRDVTDPVMTPFQRIIPPIGGLDLSPMLLFLLLDLVQRGLLNLAISTMAGNQ